MKSCYVIMNISIVENEPIISWEKLSVVNFLGESYRSLIYQVGKLAVLIL